MDWLIGIGRSRLGTGGSRKPIVEDGNKAYMTNKYLSQLLERIPKDEIQHTVPAPAGVDPNEWLATNTLAIFNHVNLLYSSISEFCTSASCGSVAAGTAMQFTWVDEKGKKLRLPAPQYIELVIVSVEKYVTDEVTFPTKYDVDFQSNFLTTVKRIFRLLFHVLGHIYQSHFNHIVELELLPHLNTVFLHFIYFQAEHNLLDPKDTQPFDDLIQAILQL